MMTLALAFKIFSVLVLASECPSYLTDQVVKGTLSTAVTAGQPRASDYAATLKTDGYEFISDAPVMSEEVQAKVFRELLETHGRTRLNLIFREGEWFLATGRQRMRPERDADGRLISVRSVMSVTRDL